MDEKACSSNWFTRLWCRSFHTPAGLKSVFESVQKPLAYCDNNVNGTLSLLLDLHQSVSAWRWPRQSSVA
jgi:UDP-glucose 4-epimerase